MRARVIARLRQEVLVRQLSGFSLRAQANQMGISHHALRCFLRTKRPVRTRDLTLWKIQDVIENKAWPAEKVVQRVQTSLKRLRPLFQSEDIDAVLDVLEKRIAYRRDQERKIQRALKKAEGGYYPFGNGP
jgi:hypothetical protein